MWQQAISQTSRVPASHAHCSTQFSPKSCEIPGDGGGNRLRQATSRRWASNYRGDDQCPPAALPTPAPRPLSQSVPCQRHLSSLLNPGASANSGMAATLTPPGPPAPALPLQPLQALHHTSVVANGAGCPTSAAQPSPCPGAFLPFSIQQALPVPVTSSGKFSYPLGLGAPLSNFPRTCAYLLALGGINSPRFTGWGGHCLAVPIILMLGPLDL